MAQEVGSIEAKLKFDISDWERKQRRVKGDIEGVRRKSHEIGKSMKYMKGGMLAVATGIGLAATASINVARNFDQAMAQVQAKSNASADELKALEQAAKHAGATTKFSSTDAANALTELAGAGFNATQMIAALPGVLQLAATSGISMKKASSIASSALNGFGLEAKDLGHVVDVLAKAAAASNADVADLGQSMKIIAPVAASLGISVEDTASALGILSNAGIEGSEAATALRGGLAQLLDPSKEVAEKMKDLGISVTDSKGKMKSFPELIGDIKTHLKGMTRAQKAQTISQLTGTDAMSAWMALINAGPDKLAKFTGKLKDSDGAAKKMSETLSDTANGDMAEFQSAVEALALKVGESLTPAFRDVLNVGADLARMLGGTYDATEDYKDATLDAIDAAHDQHEANEKLIDEFAKLRRKSGLTTDEFGRYLDILTKIKRTNSPEALADLRRQAEKLRKKSGLTNDQLDKMVDLNGKLVEKIPPATKVITEQGNHIAGNADKMRKYNDQLEQMTIRKLSEKFIDQLGTVEKITAKRARLQEKLNVSARHEAEINKILDNYSKKNLADQKKKIQHDIEHLKKLKREKFLHGESTIEIADQLDYKKRLLMVLNSNKDNLFTMLNAERDNTDEIRKQVTKEDVKLQKLEAVRRKLVEERLIQAGIDQSVAHQNAKHHTAINLVSRKIRKLKDERQKIIKNAGGVDHLNAKQRETVDTIQHQINKLDTARDRIGRLIDVAGDLNRALGRSINKHVSVRVSTYGDDNYVNSTMGQYRALMRHQGGTLPKFHEGGSPALRWNPPMSNEVDVRLLRNEMVLTEAQQASLFRLFDRSVPAQASAVNMAETNALLAQINEAVRNSDGDTVLTINGREFARATVNDVSEALHEQTARRNRAKGIL
ncbi:MAG TPA: phage tail tape measure protein [Bacillales bacterium]|nr:phage tail tape measure protein [Bacillales bacterium]